jgi:thiosulfate sulfurtransferase
MTMNNYSELSPVEAQALIKSEAARVIDIRDNNSFSDAHISGAIQLDQTSIGPFLEGTEKEDALVIYCYHGISSHSAASFFVEQGFSRVHHIVGGFEAWQQHGLPVEKV